MKVRPCSLLSCSHFLDLSKILPTTCFLRPGLEKLDVDFHTISPFVSSQTPASMLAIGEKGLFCKLFIFPK